MIEEVITGPYLVKIIKSKTMLFHAYLRNAIAYVPTVVKLQTGAYVDVDPVAVVPVANTDGLRCALLDAVGRKTPSFLPRRRTIGHRRSCSNMPA
jgi:hypothetical protein